MAVDLEKIRKSAKVAHRLLKPRHPREFNIDDVPKVCWELRQIIAEATKAEKAEPGDAWEARKTAVGDCYQLLTGMIERFRQRVKGPNAVPLRCMDVTLELQGCLRGALLDWEKDLEE